MVFRLKVISLEGMPIIVHCGSGGTKPGVPMAGMNLNRKVDFSEIGFRKETPYKSEIKMNGTL
jgi:hypothetical protein